MITLNHIGIAVVLFLFVLLVVCLFQVRSISMMRHERILAIAKDNHELESQLRIAREIRRMHILRHTRDIEQLLRRAQQAELALTAERIVTDNLMGQLTEAEHAYDVMYQDFEATARELETLKEGNALLWQTATNMAIEHGIIVVSPQPSYEQQLEDVAAAEQ